MTIKEGIVKLLQIYFALVAMILLAELLVGMALSPDQELHYSDLSTPFLTAGLCMLPVGVTFSRKELSFRQTVVRRVIQLLLIEGIMMGLTAMSDVMREDVNNYLLLGGITLVIYVLVNLFLWFQQHLQSKEMTARLRQLQQGEK